jgi:hypothetical protein
MPVIQAQGKGIQSTAAHFRFGALIKIQQHDKQNFCVNPIIRCKATFCLAVSQLAMEMHGFDDPKILEVLRKLKRNFYLANLHFNNWSCTPNAAPLLAWAYRVLWVNKRVAVVDPAVPVPAPMSPLNAPDSPTWPDCQLPTPSSRP